MAGAERAASSLERSSSLSARSPPSASTSGTRDGAMNNGSIAIALSAEYGEFCPSAISFNGSSCRKLNPASRIQQPIRMTSGISPTPQLSRDGIENSGTSRPAWRPAKKSRVMHALQDQAHAACEDVGRWQQADDEKGFVRKIEEEAGMDDDPVVRQELERDRLFIRGGGHAQHRGPSALCGKHADARVTGRHCLLQTAVVMPNAFANLIPDGRRGFDQRRCGDLHRRGYRQVRIANQIQPVGGFFHEGFGATDSHPPKLHLRKTSRLRQPTQPEQQTLAALERRRLRQWRIGERVIAEHFIQNERSIAPGATTYQLISVAFVQYRTGWIVRRHRQDCPRFRRPRPVEIDAIDFPCAVIRQRVTAIHNRVEACQVREQRIAGNWRQDVRLSGVAEQLEEERVGFAGAGRQHDSIGCYANTAPGVRLRNRLSCLGYPERLRTVRERARVGERSQQRARVSNAYARRIRDCQIDQRSTTPAGIDKRGREAVRPSILRNTPGEHLRRIFDLLIE